MIKNSQTHICIQISLSQICAYTQRQRHNFIQIILISRIPEYIIFSSKHKNVSFISLDNHNKYSRRTLYSKSSKYAFSKMS